MKKIFLLVGIGIIIGGLLSYGIVRHVATKRAEEALERMVNSTPALEELRYGKVQVGLLRSTFGLRDIELRLAGYQEPIHIDRIDVDVSEADQRIPPQAKAEITGIRLSTTHGLLAPVRKDLEALGYRDVAGLITLAYRYDAAGKRLNLEDVILRIDQMGRIRFNLALTDLDLYRLAEKQGKPDLATLMTVVPMIGVAGGRFTYSDDSFLQRLLNRTTGQPGRVYQAEAKEKLDHLLEREENERVRQILSALKRFVDNPQTVTISLSPSEPVPLLRFLWVKRPVDLLELLKVQVTT